VTSVARGACVAVVPLSCSDAWSGRRRGTVRHAVSPGRWVARPRHTGHVSLRLSGEGVWPRPQPVHSVHGREVAREALKRSREKAAEHGGACAGQISITASQSGQTKDAYSSGYHGTPRRSEGLRRAVAITNVSLPQRVRGPVLVGVPGAVGAACTRRTGHSSSPGEPGEERVATGLSSSYTTTMLLMPLP
jgi:hypothetical protein